MSIEYYIAGFEWNPGSNHIQNGDMEANSYWASSGNQSSLWYSTSYYYLPNRSLGFNVAPTNSGGEINRLYHPAPIPILYPGSKYQIDVQYLHLTGEYGLQGKVFLSDTSSYITSFIVGPGDQRWKEFKHIFNVSTIINNPILGFDLTCNAGSTIITSVFNYTNFTTWSYTDIRSWLTITPNKVSLNQRGGYGSTVYMTRSVSYDKKTINFKIEINSYSPYFLHELTKLKLVSFGVKTTFDSILVAWSFYYNNLVFSYTSSYYETSSIGIPYIRYCSLKINDINGRANLSIYYDSAMSSHDITLTISDSKIGNGIKYETAMDNALCAHEYISAVLENFGYVESSETIYLEDKKQTYFIDQVYFGPSRGWDDIGVIRIYPEWDYKAEVVQNRADHRTAGGKLYSYRWGSYKKFSIPLEYVQNSKAAIINSWWASDALIHFKIYSGGVWETNTCHMMNDDAPFHQRQKPYTNYMKGNLELETF